MAHDIIITYKHTKWTNEKKEDKKSFGILHH